MTQHILCTNRRYTQYTLVHVAAYEHVYGTVNALAGVQDSESLDVLSVGEGNNEQALVDLQLSLAA